jgi:hypothetical protein
MTEMQQAIAKCQQDVIATAEQKLGRSLTESERAGILKIDSLTALESCYQSFSSPVCTQARVLAALAHFARQV